MYQDDSLNAGDLSLPRLDPLGDVDEAEEILSDLDPETDRSAAEGVVGYSQVERVSPVPVERSLRDRAREWSDTKALEALGQVACSIAANLDLPSLIRQILDIAVQMLGAERGILFVGRGADAELIPAVARSVSGTDLDELEQISRTILRRALRGNTITSGDALADPSLRDIPSISLSQIRSVLCVPLSARGELRGAIYLDNRPLAQAFPEPSRRFLEIFAGLAAVALENAELHGEMLRENLRLKKRLDTLETFGRILTISPSMTEVLRKAALAAQSEAPVMILGESGTGKELLARAIHEASPRSLRAFVAHNCAAVPGQLMESLFFGHTRGAFTGAVRDSQGLFRLANQGVLFLDEVAELDPTLQAKLLRVLEDGRIRPVGGEQEYQVDVRLVSATSRDLYTAIEEGQFRGELFYRMNVLEIRVPPLRERREDIPVLIEHFVRKHGSGERTRARFSSDALNYLQGLAWPGNVRELENLVQRALVLSPSAVIEAQEIRKLVSPPLPMYQPRKAEATRGAGGDAFGSGPRDEAGPGMAGRGMERSPVADVFPSDARAANSSAASSSAASGTQSLAERERLAILEALSKTKHNKSEAARLLGLHRNSLLRRMKRFGIETEGTPGDSE